MTYEQTLKLSLQAYPSLNVDESDVLHHLFFVLGNGYEWTKGQLVDRLDPTPEKFLKRARENDKHIDKMHEQWRQEFLKRVGDNDESEYIAEMQRELQRERRSKDPEMERQKERERRLKYVESGCNGYFLRPDGSVGRKIYPLCESTSILHIPDDVRPDWLKAAKRALVVARRDFKCSDEDEKWLRKAEKRIEVLDQRR